MQPLVEVQDSFARALTTGRAEAVACELVGGREPRKRLAIHVRHFRASLTTALCDKLPACAWLVGADTLRAAASAFAAAHPPREPCIAEYGADFGAFLASFGRPSPLAYLESFAALEWAVAQASVSADSASTAWPALASLGANELLDTALRLQPGVRYVRAKSRVDTLLHAYLGGNPPERFRLDETPALIEVRGNRGSVAFALLGAPTFAFRSALAAGQTVGDAAADALAIDTQFDAGRALQSLVAAGLVIGLHRTSSREPAP